MFGLTILTLLTFSLILIVWGIISMQKDWEIGAAIGFVIGALVALIMILMLANIPSERLDCETEIEYIKQFQITIDNNRELQNEFERALIITEINEVNALITNWKVKGKHWYQNKWIYVPETRFVKYVK